MNNSSNFMIPWVSTTIISNIWIWAYEILFEDCCTVEESITIPSVVLRSAIPNVPAPPTPNLSDQYAFVAEAISTFEEP